LIPVNKNDEKHLVGADGDADALGPAVFGVGLGAANAKQNGNEFVLSRTRKMRKAVLNSVWLKDSY
jgi:hypothetical protein